jgi:predicted amidophosphoribosyltransferase
MLLLVLLTYPLGQVLLHGPIRRHFRRRRGLCEKCGYDLTGNTSGICPECGRETGQVCRDVVDSEGVKVRT